MGVPRQPQCPVRGRDVALADEHQHTGGWIPIREVGSPPPPFDFTHERIEVVPRLEANGGLSKEALEAALVTRIEQLLGPE